MKTINFLLLMLVSVVMTSCWTVQSVTVTDIPEKYIGNAFDDLVGMTKAEVLEDMSVPDRTMGDGLGGEILVYEKKEQVTKTTGRVTTSSTTNVSTKPITNAWTGETSLSSTGRTSTTNTQNSTSVTQEHKDYVNVFINTNGVCYKVDTNIGDLYEPAVTHQECYKVPNRGLLWMLMPPITVWGIIPAIWYAAQNAKVNRGDAKLVPCD